MIYFFSMKGCNVVGLVDLPVAHPGRKCHIPSSAYMNFYVALLMSGIVDPFYTVC